MDVLFADRRLMAEQAESILREDKWDEDREHRAAASDERETTSLRQAEDKEVMESGAGACGVGNSVSSTASAATATEAVEQPAAALVPEPIAPTAAAAPGTPSDAAELETPTSACSEAPPPGDSAELARPTSASSEAPPQVDAAELATPTSAFSEAAETPVVEMAADLPATEAVDESAAEVPAMPVAEASSAPSE